MTDPRWPTVLLAGAQRSGTTALFNILGHHPDVFVPSRKEPHYFAFAGAGVFRGPGDDLFCAEVVTADRDGYLALYEGGRDHRHRVDGSAMYLGYPGTAERACRDVPTAKVVFMLRDPVDRAYSAFLLMGREGREPLPDFAQALAAETARRTDGWSPTFWYASLSRYGTNLAEWFDAFDAARILVCVYEDFESDAVRVLRVIERHLGLDPDPSYPVHTRYQVSGDPRSRSVHRALHGTSVLKRAVKRWAPPPARRAVMRLRAANLRTPPPLDPALRASLAAELAPEVARAVALTGIDVRGKWTPSL